MKKLFALSPLLTAMLVASTAQCQGASTPNTPGPTEESFEALLTRIKNPAPWLAWGADLRVRNEYFDKAISLSGASAVSEQDVLRIRSRLWITLSASTNLVLNTRLANESREWFKPAFAKAYGPHTGLEWRYGMIDALNVKWNEAFGQPLAFSIGRQEIQLGDYYDWWLVMDGTPGDGSWTTFLDSARVNFNVASVKTKFDVIYINQHARVDEGLPALNMHQDLNSNMEQNEQGVVLYASNKSLKNVQADGYFIFKHDDKEFTTGDDADIYTFGGKLTGTPAEHWQYSVEGAYQTGTKSDMFFAERDIDAFGGKAKVTYLFKDSWKNQLCLGGEYLSGDDPNTEKDEMFDILWGRWPRWSELYIYSYINETGGKVAQLNNIGRVGPSWSCSPTDGMTVSVTYNALFAPQETPTRALVPALFSRSGNFRGHYLQTLIKHQFSKHLTGHLWGEWVWEGDYYASEETMTFLRAEMQFTF
jgi:hypothetical protein